MISEMEIIASIKLIICVLLGWIVYFWGYRSFRDDLLKYKLSKLKNTLFVKTHQMKIPMNTPSYIMMCEILDMYLRESHRMDVWAVIFGSWLKKKFPDERCFSEILDDQLGIVQNEEYRQFVRKIHDEMFFSIYWHIATGAPILLLYIVCYISYILCVELAKTTLRIQRYATIQKLKSAVAIKAEQTLNVATANIK